MQRHRDLPLASRRGPYFYRTASVTTLSDPPSEGLRCFGASDPLYARYHDEEWGRPVVDERGLYERVSLEAFQSGLAWITILRKREAFRAAFAGFDPEPSREFGEADLARLLADAGIVRNRAQDRGDDRERARDRSRCATRIARSRRSCWRTASGPGAPRRRTSPRCPARRRSRGAREVR